MRRAIVCGAGGFIGSHLVRRLKREGFWVRGVDLKFPEFAETEADDFVLADLREQENCRAIVDQRFDEVYQLAADMGGAGFVFTGENDADIMHNSAMINLNMLEACRKRNIKRIFYSSSACMYPEHNQKDPNAPITREDSAYPADPDSEYGWEKLFSERCTWFTTETTEWSAESPATIIFLALRALGWADEKRLPPHSVAKWPKRRRAGRSRCGETVYKHAPFSMSTIALKRRCGSLAVKLLRGRSISGLRRWSRSTNWPRSS